MKSSFTGNSLLLLSFFFSRETSSAMDLDGPQDESVGAGHPLFSQFPVAMYPPASVAGYAAPLPHQQTMPWPGPGVAGVSSNNDRINKKRREKSRDMRYTSDEKLLLANLFLEHLPIARRCGIL